MNRGTSRGLGGGRPTIPWARLLRPWRLIGFALAIASAVAVVWLASNHEYDLDVAAVDVSGIEFTSADTVMNTIGLAAVTARPNVFRIDTGAMRRALVALPAIGDARVDVVLPGHLVIDVTERTPVFVLRTPSQQLLVDDEGFVLADSNDSTEAAFSALPVVEDGRMTFAPTPNLTVGDRVDEISLAADLHLAALTPAVIGSDYDRLRLRIDDTDGYVLTADPGGWRAIFGHYTPTLRPLDLIDRQVECLRSRLATGEADLDTIYLAPMDDRCGTYLPRTTPGAAPGATATPQPAR
ncbi:MAG: FtsQ-type POTRA domain-containing protein [Candidatus Limnocylindrales bacterium]